MPPFALLDIEVVLAIHEEQLAVHGGGIGLRDHGLLESALARPENKIAYAPNADCASVAASYAFGLARNQPFVDGNKRTAFVAMALCLSLHGFRLIAGDKDAVMVTLRLAAGEIGEDALSQWVRANIAKR